MGRTRLGSFSTRPFSGKPSASSTWKRTQPNRHNESTFCCVCLRADRLLDGEHADWRKVHDHDLVNGYYIRAAHDLCNRQRKVTYDMPVFFPEPSRLRRAPDRQGDIHVLPSRDQADRPEHGAYILIKWGQHIVYWVLLWVLPEARNECDECPPRNQVFDLWLFEDSCFHAFILMNQDYFFLLCCLRVHRVQPGAPGLYAGD